MKIQRCKDQKDKTLEEFYSELLASEDKILKSIGQSMLNLLAAISKESMPKNIYGLTSLYQLKLLAQDTFISAWYISIISCGYEKFFIDYLGDIENDKYIRLEASNISETIKLIKLAIIKSKGWVNSIK